ncbi:MAG: iron-containing alcohol dehydrogenase [Eubacteriales bacterium]|jgi:4-hydroxybutyrate dehydrogenase|nr:iron-containing alcohol dehydrogenase [Eubacteriales bacterium]
MNSFKIIPVITHIETFAEFIKLFELSGSDLLLSEHAVIDKHIGDMDCHIIFRDDYGIGEPTSTIINEIIGIASGYNYNRVIGIGGGSVLDIAKLLAIECNGDCALFFTNKLEAIRNRSLILVPTTCGTGSEVTNISIAAIEGKNVKIGFAHDSLYADNAVLINELLYSLPRRIFLLSSLDALVHAVESFLSPKATTISRMFSENAIKTIVLGYERLLADNTIQDELIESFLTAANYAGIAFSNAGCGQIHAMAYPIGGDFHVPHGEANHQLFIAVLDYYRMHSIDNVFKQFTDIFDCLFGRTGYDYFINIIEHIIKRKPLSLYGITAKDCERFAYIVKESQQRLTSNAYVNISESEMIEIYKSLL